MSNFKSTMFNQLKVINSQYNMTSLYGPTFSRGKFMVPLNIAQLITLNLSQQTQQDQCM